ncbi:MAG: hypothetical protein ACLFR7_06510, partial [Opitutales bacterium]
RWLLGEDRSGAFRAPLLTGAPFRGEVPLWPPEVRARWEPPVAQSAGREWIFEVFTPPIVYYDPATRQFTVRPPLEPTARPSFGVELAEIARRPYRLQYAGHHGEADDFLVEIRDVEEGAFYRGRVGTFFPAGDFVLRDFRAERRLVRPQNRPGATPHLEIFLELVVEDQRRGETLILGRDPLISPVPHVVLEDANGAVSAPLLVGERWAVGSDRFVVESIDERAGEAVVSKHALDGPLLDSQTLSLDSAP